MTAPIPKEDEFNRRLAELLRKQNLSAKAEVYVGDNKTIDVLVDFGNRKIAVEAKKGDTDPKRDKALDQAAGRIYDGDAQGGAAVCYPDNLFLEDFGEDTQLMAAELGSDWGPTTVSGLAGMLRRISDDLEDIDLAAATFKKKLKAASKKLSDKQVRDIAARVDIPLDEDQKDKGETADAIPRAALRAALLVASACLFHARLDDEDIDPPRIDARTKKSYTGGWPPKRLGECLGNKDESVLETDVVGELGQAWSTILAKDYKPVFETALAVLDAAALNRGFTNFLRGCGGAALAAAGVLTRGQTDLLGRVFHYILKEAPNTGAFYTSAAAGALLAGLAVREKDVDDKRMNYHVVDPACGTGTLLAAAATRILEVSGQYGSSVIGAHLIENLLHGYDIDITATHMAAVTVGLMSPSVAFREMNIRRFELGMVIHPASGGKTAKAGSLELMGDNPFDAIAKWPQAVRSEHIDTGDHEDLDLDDTPRDLVIMNPPFTVDYLRHDQLGKEEEEAVKARERHLFAAHPAAGSHSGGMFLCLGDRLCDPENGTLAFVYPTTSCGAPSAKKVWAKLLETFHLETVVTPHDPKRMYFSEKTKISESLFVFRRIRRDNRNTPTKFVRLMRNPSTASGGERLADNLRNGILTKDYRIKEWPRERLMADDWTPVRFLSDLPASVIYERFAKKDAETVPLGRIAEVGPDGRGIRGTYLPEAFADEAGRRGLWYNNQIGPAKNGAPPKNTMRVGADCYLHPNPAAKKRAHVHSKRRGRLFLPGTFRLTSAKTFAVRTDERALSSQWVPVRPQQRKNDAEVWEKAMCVYLNSTIGILAQIWVSKPGKDIARPAMPLKGMQRIPVPDLTKDQAVALARTYHRLQDKPLQRFREQADDTVRHTLDTAVCDVFGWDIEEVSSVRQVLVEEPTLTGKRVGE